LPHDYSMEEIIAYEENAFGCVVHTLDSGHWLRSGRRNPDANVRSFTSYPYCGSGKSGAYSHATTTTAHTHTKADCYVCSYPCLRGNPGTDSTSGHGHHD
jgi:hypothetical protein